LNIPTFLLSRRRIATGSALAAHGIALGRYLRFHSKIGFRRGREVATTPMNSYRTRDKRDGAGVEAMIAPAP
jgi:uncharacterized membrane protein